MRNAIKEYANFPNEGVTFYDIFSVTLDSKSAQVLMDLVTEHALEHAGEVDKVVGLNARGFLFSTRHQESLHSHQE